MAVLKTMAPVENQDQMPVALPSGGVTMGKITLVNNVLVYAFATELEVAVPNQANVSLQLEQGPTGAGSGNPNVQIYTGVVRCEKVEVEKTTGQAVAAGQALYWVSSTDKVSTSASGNYPCGFAIRAATAGDTSVIAVWDGTKAA